MSLYSELLQQALDTSKAGANADVPTPELVAELSRHRDRLGGLGPDAFAQKLQPETVGLLLAYDVALVRLCEHAGVVHGLTDPFAPPDARDRLLARLAARHLLAEAPHPAR